MRPPVCVENGCVKLLVREVEPGRALVIQVCKSEAVWRDFALAARMHCVIALLNEGTCRLCNSSNKRIVCRLESQWPREREGLESRRRCVPGPIFQGSAHTESLYFVDA